MRSLAGFAIVMVLSLGSAARVFRISPDKWESRGKNNYQKYDASIFGAPGLPSMISVLKTNSMSFLSLEG
jgi:hypothetical protein